MGAEGAGPDGDFRLVIDGISEIVRIAKKAKRTDWGSYKRHSRNNIAHLGRRLHPEQN